MSGNTPSGSGFQLRGVTVQDSARVRLRDIDLELDGGAIAVLGESGAGKTTLLEVLVGFVDPTRGTVSRPRSAKGGVPWYWVPPGGGLWPHLDVRRHLDVVAPRTLPVSEVAALLDRLDLTAVAERRPSELSDGQRARLSLARALATRAETLILDEPLAHVDVRSKAAALQLLEEARDRGTALVFATHDGPEALAHAERCIVLREGALTFDGSSSKLYEDPPTPELAALLGPVHWMEAQERARFLAEDSGNRCVRPEQLRMSVQPDGPLEVREVQKQGALQRVRLCHLASGEQRSFELFRWAVQLAVGDRAILQRILIALCTLTVLCCGSGDPRTLEFSSLRTVSLPPEGAQTPAPRALGTTRAGHLLVLDTLGRVLRFDAQGRCLAHWWMPETAHGRPEGILELADGRIAVADTHYHRVVVFDAEGNFLDAFGREGTGPGEFLYPVKLAQDPAGVVYVAEYGSNDRVQRFTPDGKFLSAFGSFGTETGQFQRIGGVVWHSGRLYVADAINHRIQVFTDAGDFVEVLGGPGQRPLAFPYDLCLDPSGRLVTVEYDGDCVTVLGLDGTSFGSFGSAGRALGQFSTPWGVRVMQSGAIWVADTGNRRLVELIP